MSSVVFQRTKFNELQKCRLDLIFFNWKNDYRFFLIYFASWYLNQFLMIIYCDEFAVQLYAVQYKIVFFKQSFTNQRCTRSSSCKVTVHCTSLVFKQNADECKIPVLNYVDPLRMTLEHYVVTDQSPVLFFWDLQKAVYTFWVLSCCDSLVT